jgi:hypothetical protein
MNAHYILKFSNEQEHEQPLTKSNQFKVTLEYQLPLESMICLINLLRLVTMTNLNICKVNKIWEKIYAYGWLELVFLIFFKWNSVGNGRLLLMKNNLDTWNKIWWHIVLSTRSMNFYGNNRDPKFNIL